jgi:hypothetical protein
MSDKEMAPTVHQHPEARTTRGALVIKASVAYVLCRIEDDSSLTPVSEYEDILTAVAAGKHKVEVEDFDFSYGLFVDGGRVASFAEGRIGYREWARRNGRLGDIHSLDDRYDHDIDELMS